MKSGVPPKHESPPSDSLAVSRRPVSRAGRKTFRVGAVPARTAVQPAVREQRPGRRRDRGPGNGGQLLGAGRLDGHQHRPHDDVRRPGPEPRLVGDRRSARARSDARRRRGRDRRQERSDHRLQRRRLASEQRLGRDRPRGSGVPAGRSHRQQLAAAVIGKRHARRPGQPQRGVHLPDRLHADHRARTPASSLVNGAQACNVFWQVGSSATLGTGTSFVGTIMASASITANTAATIHGRLLARTGAVTLDTNTITTSNCASSVTGSGGGTETTTACRSARRRRAARCRRRRSTDRRNALEPRPNGGGKTRGRRRAADGAQLPGAHTHRRTRRAAGAPAQARLVHRMSTVRRSSSALVGSLAAVLRGRHHGRLDRRAAGTRPACRRLRNSSVLLTAHGAHRAPARRIPAGCARARPHGRSPASRPRCP